MGRPLLSAMFLVAVLAAFQCVLAAAEPAGNDHRAWLEARIAAGEEADAAGDTSQAAAAYRDVFDQIGHERLLWSKRAETPVRDRALARLLELGAAPSPQRQIEHFMDLAQLGGAGRRGRGALIRTWTASGIWQSKRDALLLRRVTPLARPRRKRRLRPPIASDHGPMNALRDALNREMVLTQHAHHARDGRSPWLWPDADPEVAASLLGFAALQRRSDDAPRLIAAVPIETRGRLAWPAALVLVRLAYEHDLPSLHRAAQRALLVAGAGDRQERPVDLALSSLSPSARASYFSGVLDARAGALPTACDTWRTVAGAGPGYYGVLARAQLATRCVPATHTALPPEALWLRYLRGMEGLGYDGQTPRFDRPDPRPLRQTLPRKGLPSTWMLAIARQESGLQPHVCSPSGACGLFQLKPGTARNVQADLGWTGEPDLSDPEANAAIANAFLRRLETRCGSPLVSLAAYNAGPHAVARWDLGDLPGDLAVELMPSPRTQAYVRGITVRYGLYAQWLDAGALRMDLIGQTPSVILRAR